MIIESKCNCGEAISIELNCKQRTSRTDKKRPFYPDEGLPEGLDPKKYDASGVSVFSCRSCGEPVSKTVPGAEYESIKLEG